MLSNGALITLHRKDMDLLDFNYNMNVMDILIAQGAGAICSHIDIINRYKVKLFVELGMYMGGTLPHVIPNLVLDPSFTYIGFEILPGAEKPSIIAFAANQPNCHVIIEDIFTNANLQRIRDCINSTNGAVYILCDGGNKPKELLTFSKMLRIGDIISVHDYTDDQTGEIRDVDLAQIGDDFVFLDEKWRKDILWLPTFIKIK